ncbi:CPBP family intramembrane glutamic endopeptidase [Microbacterium algeriense]|uniref:CPBP family intramembrane metalloprotease n=1 Tax=Microbacterium algeriense TaxID=2615184 RepID=A0ABQ6V359_9MICO|nr:CPBP family intramembrane glutamic endopeptidase [Microbacterium algeriense]KAB1862387.1 CPBP family intramembrane metalloprotease [Microbacterium algeriense]MDX2399450.1 CPBP family intramembrane metalloprotease [Microbacterium algeriense]
MHLTDDEGASARTDNAPQRGRAVRPGVEYHRTLAGDKRRVGRGILAIVLLLGGMWAGILGSVLLARLFDQAVGIPPVAEGRGGLTPSMHILGMFANALLIPLSMLIQRWLYGVPFASFYSVFSRFRFALFARALFVILPVFIVMNVVGSFLLPTESVAWVQSEALWMLAGTLLLVPLQATGEEFGLRGLVFRVAGSWGRGPRTSLVLGIAVTGFAFAALHLAMDPWLWVWYFLLAITTCLITWRSGGIEIAIVLHVAFNTLNYVFAVGTSGDLSGASDRSGGNSTIAVSFILPALIFIAATIVVWFRTRGTGPITTPPVDWRPDDWQSLHGIADGRTSRPS